MDKHIVIIYICIAIISAILLRDTMMINELMGVTR